MGLNDILKIGDRIKKIRKGKGITQKAMAELLQIPYSTYSNYENNNRTPDKPILNKIAAILDVDVRELLGLERGTQNIPKITFSPETLDEASRWNKVRPIHEKYERGEALTEEEEKALSDYIKHISSDSYKQQLQERRKKLSKDAESLIKTYSSLNAEDRAKVEEYAEMLAKFRKTDDGHTQ